MKKFFFFAAAAIAALSMNAQQITFTEDDMDILDLDGYVFNADGFKLTCTDEGGKMAVDANNCYFGDADEQIKFEYRLKTGGKSTSKNALTLTIPAAGKLYIYARTGKNEAVDRNVVVTQFGSELLNHVMLESEAIEVAGLDSKEPEKMTKVYPILTCNVSAGEVVIAYPVGSINFYGFSLGAPIAPTQGLEAQVAEPVKAAKRIVDGQVVIEKDGRLFNLLGAEIK